MLLITGTQRSGTSLVAKFFDRAGYKMEKEDKFWYEETDSGMESIKLGQLFSQELGEPDFPFSDFPEGEASAEIRAEIAKFSYLLMNPVFPYLLHKNRETTDNLLILKRDAGDVYRSKERIERFDKDSLLLKQEPEEIEKNFHRSIKVLNRLGFQYQVLYFPAFLEDYDRFEGAVKQLGIDLDPSDHEVWDQVVDHDKVHFGSSQNPAIKILEGWFSC